MWKQKCILFKVGGFPCQDIKNVNELNTTSDAREILHRVVTNESKDATIHMIQQLFDSPSAATTWSVPQFAVEEF